MPLHHGIQWISTSRCQPAEMMMITFYLFMVLWFIFDGKIGYLNSIQLLYL